MGGGARRICPRGDSRQDAKHLHFRGILVSRAELVRKAVSAPPKMR